MTWRTPICILLLACTAAAAGLDGRWSVEVTPRGTKGAKGNSVGYIFDLQTNGSQVTGSVIAMQGRNPHPMPLVNGTLEDDHFFFTTVQTSRKSGSTMSQWEGTISGDQISGKHTGSRRRASFIGKRQH